MMKTISEQRCFGGVQGVYEHQADTTGTAMRFAVYQPPQALKQPCPVLWYLSGLTCTEENFTVKAGAQRYAAEHGLVLIAPDTSPRGAGVAGEDDDYDLGAGAGFYVDATEEPWRQNYQMYSYIVDELPALIEKQFPIRSDAQGITGHSMGGHGALVIGLRNPQRYRSISAFAPIVAPMQVPWGVKALTAYVGADKALWRQYDSVALIEDGARPASLLVDQGTADQFLQDQLQPERLQQACDNAGISLNLRMQEGYDHSYYFIATFIGEHIAWHGENLTL
ncbi:MAG: S-formylglutathione hydrolase [Wenzhouxiangellaceae bacterium]